MVSNCYQQSAQCHQQQSHHTPHPHHPQHAHAHLQHQQSYLGHSTTGASVPLPPPAASAGAWVNGVYPHAGTPVGTVPAASLLYWKQQQQQQQQLLLAKQQQQQTTQGVYDPIYLPHHNHHHPHHHHHVHHQQQLSPDERPITDHDPQSSSVAEGGCGVSAARVNNMVTTVTVSAASGGSGRGGAATMVAPPHCVVSPSARSDGCGSVASLCSSLSGHDSPPPAPPPPQPDPPARPSQQNDESGGVVASIMAPLRWNRVTSNGVVVYISPSGVSMTCVQEAREYLRSPGTCKCGLECPINVEQVFNFDPKVITRSWSSNVTTTSVSAGGSGCAADAVTSAVTTSTCNHRRKWTEQAAHALNFRKDVVPTLQEQRCNPHNNLYFKQQMLQQVLGQLSSESRVQFHHHQQQQQQYGDDLHHQQTLHHQPQHDQQQPQHPHTQSQQHSDAWPPMYSDASVVATQQDFSAQQQQQQQSQPHRLVHWQELRRRQRVAATRTRRRSCSPPLEASGGGASIDESAVLAIDQVAPSFLDDPSGYLAQQQQLLNAAITQEHFTGSPPHSPYQRQSSLSHAEHQLSHSPPQQQLHRSSPSQPISQQQSSSSACHQSSLADRMNGEDSEAAIYPRLSGGVPKNEALSAPVSPQSQFAPSQRIPMAMDVVDSNNNKGENETAVMLDAVKTEVMCHATSTPVDVSNASTDSMLVSEFIIDAVISGSEEVGVCGGGVGIEECAFPLCSSPKTSQASALMTSVSPVTDVDDRAERFEIVSKEELLAELESSSHIGTVSVSSNSQSNDDSGIAANSRSSEEISNSRIVTSTPPTVSPVTSVSSNSQCATTTNMVSSRSCPNVSSPPSIETGTIKAPITAPVTCGGVVASCSGRVAARPHTVSSTASSTSGTERSQRKRQRTRHSPAPLPFLQGAVSSVQHSSATVSVGNHATLIAASTASQTFTVTRQHPALAPAPTTLSTAVHHPTVTSAAAAAPAAHYQLIGTAGDVPLLQQLPTAAATPLLLPSGQLVFATQPLVQYVQLPTAAQHHQPTQQQPAPLILSNGTLIQSGAPAPQHPPPPTQQHQPSLIFAAANAGGVNNATAGAGGSKRKKRRTAAPQPPPSSSSCLAAGLAQSASISQQLLQQQQQQQLMAAAAAALPMPTLLVSSGGAHAATATAATGLNFVQPLFLPAAAAATHAPASAATGQLLIQTASGHHVLTTAGCAGTAAGGCGGQLQLLQLFSTSGGMAAAATTAAASCASGGGSLAAAVAAAADSSTSALQVSPTDGVVSVLSPPPMCSTPGVEVVSSTVATPPATAALPVSPMPGSDGVVAATPYHKRKLQQLQEPVSGSYLCVGDLVLGYNQGVSTWPGQIIHRADMPKTVGDEAWVRWFGDHTMSLVPCRQLKKFHSSRATVKPKKSSALNTSFEEALQEALVAVGQIRKQ